MSRYSKMLAEAIEKQGKLLKEVSVELERLARKEGWPGPFKMDIATLSRLRDGKQLPPTEPEPGDPTPSKNRLLARILGIPEKQFVLAAAIEHTPRVVLDDISTSVNHIIKELFNSTDEVTRLAIQALARETEGLTPGSEDWKQAYRLRAGVGVAKQKHIADLYAALFVTGPYQTYDDTEEKKLLQENNPLFREATQETLVRVLAEIADVPGHAITAFIKTMQDLRAAEKPKQPTPTRSILQEPVTREEEWREEP